MTLAEQKIFRPYFKSIKGVSEPPFYLDESNFLTNYLLNNLISYC